MLCTLAKLDADAFVVAEAVLSFVSREGMLVRREQGVSLVSTHPLCCLNAHRLRCKHRHTEGGVGVCRRLRDGPYGVRHMPRGVLRDARHPLLQIQRSTQRLFASQSLQVSHEAKSNRLSDQLSEQHYQHNQGRHIEARAARKLSKGLRGSKHATNSCWHKPTYLDAAFRAMLAGGQPRMRARRRQRRPPAAHAGAPLEAAAAAAVAGQALDRAASGAPQQPVRVGAAARRKPEVVCGTEGAGRRGPQLNAHNGAFRGGGRAGCAPRVCCEELCKGVWLAAG